MATLEEMLGPEAHCWLVGSLLAASADVTGQKVWRAEKRLYSLELVIVYLSQMVATLWLRIQKIKNENDIQTGTVKPFITFNWPVCLTLDTGLPMEVTIQ